MLEELRRALGIRRRVRVLGERRRSPCRSPGASCVPWWLLPEGARQWPPARLRTVLLHELAHVERLDLLRKPYGAGGLLLLLVSSARLDGPRAKLRKESASGVRRCPC